MIYTMIYPYSVQTLTNIRLKAGVHDQFAGMQTFAYYLDQKGLIEIAKLTGHDHIGEVLVFDDELHAMILDDFNAREIE